MPAASAELLIPIINLAKLGIKLTFLQVLVCAKISRRPFSPSILTYLAFWPCLTARFYMRYSPVSAAPLRSGYYETPCQWMDLARCLFHFGKRLSVPPSR